MNPPPPLFQKLRAWARRLAAPQGFSMLEVLVAATVVTFGMMALMRMQVVAMQANKSSDRMAGAVSLAQAELGRLASLNYFLYLEGLRERRQPVYDGELTATTAPTMESVTIGGTTYEVGYTVCDSGPASPECMGPEQFEEGAYKQLRVTVRYRDPQRLTGTKEFTLGPYIITASFR